MLAYIRENDQSERKVREKEREKDGKRALVSFFPSTRGVSVKIDKVSRELL